MPRALPARSDFPPFRARAPWWGPDLQTLRNVLRGPLAALPNAEAEGSDSARLVLPLRDGSGDALSALLLRPRRATQMLVALVHGLGGDETSAYLGCTARELLASGHPVLVLNLRGAGASRSLCRQQYHAGRCEDLRDALLGLDASLLSRGIAMVGFSLGGNVLLKLAALHADELPLRAVVSVSTPIDLRAASLRFLEPRNRFYHWHMLRGMKRECFGGRSAISESEAEAVRAARSVWEFDDVFVAPRNGFRSAEHYYHESSARRFLAELRIPALLIHALDDPWIPPESYTGFDWSCNPHLVPALSPGGGHVGFHGAGDRRPWHDRCIRIFLDALSREARKGSEEEPRARARASSG